MMADIYHSANKVLVYLGEKDLQNTSDWEMDLIEDVDRRVPSTSQPWMGTILERTRFSRIWITQEIARSKVPYYLVNKDRSLWGEVPQRMAKKYIVCMGVTVLMS